MKRKHFNEKGEEPQSLSMDLAKKILRDQKSNNPSVFYKTVHCRFVRFLDIHFDLFRCQSECHFLFNK